MFEKIQILKQTGAKLYPYFVPSWNNCVRVAGFISSIMIVPVANYFLPTIFLGKDGESSDSNSKNNNTDFVTTLASASVVAVMYGLQKTLSAILTTSTMQVIRHENVQKLMGDSKFLIHGNCKDITSLQYVTVGVGVRDFAQNAVPVFTALPMGIMSSASTLVHIGLITGSFTTSGIVFAFASASAIVTYLFSKKASEYLAYNQMIENDLVAKTSFIEANKSAISLMGASDTENDSIMKSLDKINSTIPMYSVLVFVYFLLNSLSPAIASQFLGSYYTNGSVKNLSSNDVKVLNIMIMSLLTNVQDMVWILTNNYSYIKLNLEQLNAFDKAYKECFDTRNANNKMHQHFYGERLSFIDFTVYRPNLENEENIELITMFNKVRLDLPPLDIPASNKVYKLIAPSGGGKTTFLKAITGNWQYTDGTVAFPTYAKDNIYFIPQHSFIPKGTILEIITYPFKPQEFVIKNSILPSQFVNKLRVDLSVNSFDEKSEKPKYESIVKKGDSSSSQGLYLPLLNSADKEDSGIDLMLILIRQIKSLLSMFRLLPNVIKEDELQLEDVIWNERLSGGEKQKIGIIRAILAKPKFIIMDEATSALDKENKQLAYAIVQDYIATLENYTVIYTDHDNTEHFADATLSIIGQNLYYHDVL